MKLNTNALLAIESFFESINRKSLKRGREYWLEGRVAGLMKEGIDSEYLALVDGGERYEVSLRFSKRHWFGQCSCPMMFDCKHIVAALLELQEQAGGSTKPPTLPPGTAPQPRRSPLSEKLISALGRKLSSHETQIVKRVQNFYTEARNRDLMESDLAAMSGRPQQFYGWQKLDLWPTFPKDDYYFWLHVAWELRRRNSPIPEFLQSITDLELIQAAMAELERRQEIEEWKNWFSEFQVKADADRAVGSMELRLMISSDQARLQWRQDKSLPYCDFKQTHAKQFADQFDRGELILSEESIPLWSATYKPWHYNSWWSFKFSDSTARPALKRLLRLNLPAERLVGEDGQPILRHSEKLRLQLRPPEDEKDDYEIELMRADGSPPPKIHCALEGKTTLYVTAEGLFEGPSNQALETKTKRKIPAVALETADGVRFLTAVNVPLPARLQSRMRTVRVQIVVKCELAPIYMGSPSEDICISILAEAPEMKSERLTANGWESFTAKAERPKTAAGGDEFIVHDRSMQQRMSGVIAALSAKWSGYPAAWRLRVTKKTPEIFLNWLKLLPPEVEVLLDKQLATLRDEPVSGVVSLDVSENGIDWFDLKVALNIGDTKLTPDELKLLLNARGGYVRLGKKGWRRLQFNLSPEEDEQLARLGLNPRDLSAEPQRFHALQLADDAAKRFLPEDQVERIHRRVAELKTRVSPPLPKELSVEMRPYQTDGYHFLAYLAANRFGGVLADDMGLGKTVQTLAWLAWLRKEAPTPQSSLVVCPKSVMDNWRAEAERFYPALRVRLWRGESVRELTPARETNDLIVINYSQLRSLLPAIADAQWLAAILDEAQYIKNPDSQTAQAARGLKAEYRLALTGTPIENRLLDLWSILAFAMPGALGNRSHFLKRFDAKDDPLARRRLAARVRPFLLRRTKSQVAKDLPDRIEEDLLCEMEGEQKTLYRAELKRARQMVLGLQTNKQLNDQRFNILTSLLRLRQICCHPALVDEKLRRAESAKVAALEDVLEPLMEEGHKTLVFSQFVTMLDLLRERATERGWRHFYLAGETENRGELVKQFQSSKDAAVFFISLKAGGFGLNLTAASYVVLFDPWWNPAVENQAIDRTHRIGQTSKVMAYRLLMRDSIEEKIRALQKQKSALVEDVLGEERFAQSLTLDDLKFLFAD
jgi:superfamily II DNA or RNA helicase